MYICRKNSTIYMIQQLFIFSPFEWLLLAISLVALIALLLYYFILYARPLRQAKKRVEPTEEKTLLPVSVIVYSDGNADILRSHLPSILNQDYPNYEVVVVNDGSDPDCEDVLKLFSHE